MQKNVHPKKNKKPSTGPKFFQNEIIFFNRGELGIIDKLLQRVSRMSYGNESKTIKLNQR